MNIWEKDIVPLFYAKYASTVQKYDRHNSAELQRVSCFRIIMSVFATSKTFLFLL